MRRLHVVGFTTDLDGLIFSTRKGSKSGSFVVPISDELLDKLAEAERLRNGTGASTVAASGGERSSRRDEGEPVRTRPASELTPREIQARLRAGRSIDEVAKEARVDREWVERFAAPILAEQAKVVDLARSLTYSKSRLGESALPLGESVATNLVDRGVRFLEEEFDAGWSAFQLHDSVWMVQFEYRSRGRQHLASWEIDVGARQLTSRDRHASDLAFVDRGRRSRGADVDEPDTEPEPSPVRVVGPVRQRTVTVPAVGERAVRKPPAARRGAAKRPAAKRPATKRATTKPAATKRATTKPAATKRAATRAARTRPAAKRAVTEGTGTKAVSRKAAATKAATRMGPRAVKARAKTTPATKATKAIKATKVVKERAPSPPVAATGAAKTKKRTAPASATRATRTSPAKRTSNAANATPVAEVSGQSPSPPEASRPRIGTDGTRLTSPPPRPRPRPTPPPAEPAPAPRARPSTPPMGAGNGLEARAARPASERAAALADRLAVARREPPRRVVLPPRRERVPEPPAIAISPRDPLEKKDQAAEEDDGAFVIRPRISAKQASELAK